MRGSSGSATGRSHRRGMRKPARAGCPAWLRASPGSTTCDRFLRRRNESSGAREMKICFMESPPEKQIGGLSAAIASMREALRHEGVAVVGAEELATADVAHFHGLWQPAHSALSRECRAREIPYI